MHWAAVGAGVGEGVGAGVGAGGGKTIVRAGSATCNTLNTFAVDVAMLPLVKLSGSSASTWLMVSSASSGVKSLILAKTLSAASFSTVLMV